MCYIILPMLAWKGRLNDYLNLIKFHTSYQFWNSNKMYHYVDNFMEGRVASYIIIEWYRTLTLKNPAHLQNIMNPQLVKCH